ncbi:MAG: diacylglycerol kinase family protein [Chloroflexota bacterium]|nr:diacylglycerol kinase family protein [Chloroflexota bacterium]
MLVQERASFRHAFAGLRHAWKTQRHLRIHAVLGAIAGGAAILLRLSPGEWAVLLLTIALVFALEMLNTVVEVVVDMISPDYHPQAKVAKDVAAGAVLITALGAVAVGVAIFLPRLAVLLR